MKRVTICLLFSAISVFSVKAQSVYIQGGVNFANITIDDEGQTEDNNMLTTFNAGLMARFEISKLVSIESGLLFTGQGSKTETSFTTTGPDQVTKVTADFNPFYIQLPLNVVLNLQSSTGGPSFFVHAGPYVAIGVTGKSTITTYGSVAGTVKTESDIKFSDDTYTFQEEEPGYRYLKRLDYGINVGGGVNLKKLILKANFAAGLSNINTTKSMFSDMDDNKYRTFSLSLGIPLGN